MPLILIALAGSLFFVFTNPLFDDVSTLTAEVSSYNEALDNSKALENERDKLTAKFNAINPENLRRLEKLLPQNVDNIRLILEIEQIAKPYSMVLKDVKYSTMEDKEKAENEGAVIQPGRLEKDASKNYGSFDLEFSVSGTYNDFINFTRDLENNLRIVDIISVSFSSDSGNTPADPNKKTTGPEVYKYDLKIRTYWLKN
jgi:Tfp pilus assembly protein PilO